MKKTVFTFSVMFFVLALSAQVRLDVEGDGKIGGNLLLFHPIDTNSIHIGLNAGLNTTYNMGGGLNTFIGRNAGKNTNIGIANVYVGTHAGRENVNGWCNTFVGIDAGVNDNSTNNVFIGAACGRDNVLGWGNVYIGRDAGLQSNGFRNTFVGIAAGANFLEGWDNTFIGEEAGVGMTYGFDNIALGSFPDFTNDSLVNAIVIGSSAVVNASNKVRIGNTNISVAEVQVNWSVTSDQRYKKNIKAAGNGLDFVLALKPVSYQYDHEKMYAERKEATAKARSNQQPVPENGLPPYPHDDEEAAIRDREELETAKEKSKETYYGFLAQEVEEAANQTGYADFSGIVTPDINGGKYALRYAEFVVPLVDAVQQQQRMIAERDGRIERLERELAELKKLVKICLDQKEATAK